MGELEGLVDVAVPVFSRCFAAHVRPGIPSTRAGIYIYSPSRTPRKAMTRARDVTKGNVTHDHICWEANHMCSSPLFEGLGRVEGGGSGLPRAARVKVLSVKC